MIRDAGIMKLYPGAWEEYERRHKEVWPEVLAALKKAGIKNYSLFLNKEANEIISYLEIDENVKPAENSADEITKKWWDYMADLMETNEDNSPIFIGAREVFHMD